MSRYLMLQTQEISKKTTLRMTAEMKRTHCRKCANPILTKDFRIVRIGRKLFLIRKCEHCLHECRIFVKRCQ